jgi:hypothetical protein
LKGFQILDFSLPSTMVNGGTVLTAGGTADITGATVSIGSISGSRSIGDAITLIDVSAGTLTGTPANNTASASGYTFSIAVESGKLTATVVPVTVVPVTAVPGGGGCDTGFGAAGVIVLLMGIHAALGRKKREGVRAGYKKR